MKPKKEQIRIYATLPDMQKFPLRLPRDLYNRLSDFINDRKKLNPSISRNNVICDLIDKFLNERQNHENTNRNQ
jgi:metal-responsive CopG/Arc/MetJ family transcriptional regulator